MKRILIAEDHSIVMIGTKQLLKNLLPDAEISGVDNFKKAVQALGKQPFDLIIMDINIPGGNNVNMIHTIRAKQADIRILVFSSYDEQLYALPFLKAGADGYLSKDASEDDFKRAIESIFLNNKYLSDTMKQESINLLINPKRSSNSSVYSLSVREREITQLLLEGHGTAEIAGILNLHLSTVSTYKSRIFDKLGVTNVMELSTMIKLKKEL